MVDSGAKLVSNLVGGGVGIFAQGFQVVVTAFRFCSSFFFFSFLPLNSLFFSFSYFFNGEQMHILCLVVYL